MYGEEKKSHLTLCFIKSSQLCSGEMFRVFRVMPDVSYIPVWDIV